MPRYTLHKGRVWKDVTPKDNPEPPKPELSEEDYGMIKYFWQERGDITRWIDWEKKLPIIEKCHPELIKAMKDLEIAHRILDAIVKGLP